MNTSIGCLKELIGKIGDDWKQTLDAFFKDDEDNIDSELASDIIDFLDACKEEIISGQTSNLQKVEKLVDNDLLYKNIRSDVDEMLRPYYAAAPLRAWEAKDPEMAESIIEKIIEFGILRFDPNITKKYEEYGFDNQGAFIDFLNVYDAICTFVIGKNLCCEAMEEFIYFKTRMPERLCKKTAKLLDENYRQLQINYIIEKLNKLDD